MAGIRQRGGTARLWRGAMEWKLERLAACRVRRDEAVLWERVMKTLGRDFKRSSKTKLQRISKTPDFGKTSYSRFKKSILRRRAGQIPVASSPITTRWHCCHEHNADNPLCNRSSSTELSHSSEDNCHTPVQLVLLPYLTDASETSIPECDSKPPSADETAAHSLTKRSIRKCVQRRKLAFLQHQAHAEEHKGGLSQEIDTAIRICEGDTCPVKGCQSNKKVFEECSDGNVQPEVRLHVSGLRNDYYLNLLDWSSENLVALGLKSSTYVWNAGDHSIAQVINVHPPSTYVSSVSWMNAGTCLAIGTSNGEVQLWDTETRKRLRNMLGHMSVVGALSWNQHVLSSGSRLGHIHHHDVRVAQHHMGTLHHKHSVCSLKWSPSEKHLASGSSDGYLNIWPYDPGSSRLDSPLQSILHPTAVKAVDWCPWLSDTLAVGGGMTDGQIRIWDTSSGKSIHSKNTNSQICSILWLPETRELLTSHGTPRNQLSLWQYPGLKELTDVHGHRGRVLYVALSPDHKRIFSLAGNNTAVIWNYPKSE